MADYEKLLRDIIEAWDTPFQDGYSITKEMDTALEAAKAALES